jgi:chaperone modulatory protein CbpM
MENQEFIDPQLFCAHHKIEYAFISALQQSGLIEMTTVEEKTFIPLDELQRAEQFARMHYELDINLEGIEAIAGLLDRINVLQREAIILRNRLRIYEQQTDNKSVSQ